MLKALKGARVLVDCETNELHIDLGDGNCKPIGCRGPVVVFLNVV